MGMAALYDRPDGPSYPSKEDLKVPCLACRMTARALTGFRSPHAYAIITAVNAGLDLTTAPWPRTFHGSHGVLLSGSD